MVPLRAKYLCVTTSMKFSLSEDAHIRELPAIEFPENVKRNELEDKHFIHISGKYARRNSTRHHRLLITEVLLDFAKNTTLHGLKYVSEKGLSVVERLFWIATFLISIVLCSFLIRNVWVKWDTSPVIVTIGEKLVHVSEVPVPSVTICPTRKCMPSKYNYTFYNEKYKVMGKYIKFAPNGALFVDEKDFKNVTTRELNLHQNIDWICDVTTNHVSELSGQLFSDHSVTLDIFSVSPNLSEMFLSCLVQGIFRDCRDIFTGVMTKEGQCFTFNTLPAHEMFDDLSFGARYMQMYGLSTFGWTIEDGYDNNVEFPFPIRAVEVDMVPDLTVILKTRPEDHDQMCNIMTDGFKIYLQHPVDMPNTPLFDYSVAINETMSLGVEFTKMSTSDALKSYSKKMRQCYFPDDYPLKYFKHYTQSNCRLESLANATFDKCNCVVFYMPHDSNQVCTKLQMQCVLFASADISKGLGHISYEKCLPLCNEVKYKAVVTKAEFNYRKLINSTYNLTSSMNEKLPEGEGYNEFSEISVYFKEPHFIAMHRSQLFGLTDFLANIGGLLGLFLGFSFLSLIEIVYYVTLRFSCILKRHLEE